MAGIVLLYVDVAMTSTCVEPLGRVALLCHLTQLLHVELGALIDETQGLDGVLIATSFAATQGKLL